MFTGTYLLAGVPLRICSQYEEVQHLCSDYCTDLAPELVIETLDGEIEEEGRLSDQQRELEGLPPFHFPLPYLETLSIYRKIATSLLSRGILLMHGSVVAVEGVGYMFTALSGTGKSTHVRLWRELFGPRAVMINDDKPLLRITANQVLVYGTPWDGKHHLSTNTNVPLRAIVLLERGAENEIHPLSVQEAFPVLLQQSFRTEDPVQTLQVLQLLSLLARQVSLYNLHCNMDPEAARVAYRGMNP